jgi:mono/diheme cytochrome c family protein
MATRSRSRWNWTIAPILSLAVSAAAATPGGNAAAGKALFAKRCQGCHTIERVAGLGDRVRNDMRRVNQQMSVLGLLWDEEVANLRAYLNSVPRTKSGAEQDSGRALTGRRKQ